MRATWRLVVVREAVPMGPADARLAFNSATPLLTLPVELIGRVLDHPLLGETVNFIASMIRDLRRVDESAQFVEFQELLLSRTLQVGTQRASLARDGSRRRGGRSVSKMSEAALAGDPDDPDAWALAEYTHARSLRQLRALGDGLAWRAFGYERAIIAALSANRSPGPVVKKIHADGDLDVGLRNEIEQIRVAWRDCGIFLLHHDLTDCLRVGDATAFHPDGQRELHEFKTGDRKPKSVQRARLKQALEAINEGAPLPGGTMAVSRVGVAYTTDIPALSDAVHYARTRFCQGCKLPEGRAIVAISLIGSQRPSDIGAAMALWTRERSGALKRAGIGVAEHHLRMTSFDIAGRSPLVPPWAIYPLEPDECAGMICDLIAFESVVSGLAILRSLEREGLRTELRLPDGNSTLDPKTAILRTTNGRNELSVYPNGLSPMMLELLRPSTWAAGTSELLRSQPRAPQAHPLFLDDDRHWMPRLHAA